MHGQRPSLAWPVWWQVGHSEALARSRPPAIRFLKQVCGAFLFCACHVCVRARCMDMRVLRKTARRPCLEADGEVEVALGVGRVHRKGFLPCPLGLGGAVEGQERGTQVRVHRHGRGGGPEGPNEGLVQANGLRESPGLRWDSEDKKMRPYELVQQRKKVIQVCTWCIVRAAFSMSCGDDRPLPPPSVPEKLVAPVTDPATAAGC